VDIDRKTALNIRRDFQEEPTIPVIPFGILEAAVNVLKPQTNMRQPTDNPHAAWIKTQAHEISDAGSP
jgi:hypothetical protein